MATESTENTNNDPEHALSGPKSKSPPASRGAVLVLLLAAAVTAITILLAAASVGADNFLRASPTIEHIQENNDGHPATTASPAGKVSSPVTLRTTKSDRSSMERLVADHVQRSGGFMIFENGKQRSYLTQHETAQALRDQVNSTPDDRRVKPEHYADLRDHLLQTASGRPDTMIVVTVQSPALERPLFRDIIVGSAYVSIAGILVIMLAVATLGLSEIMRESKKSRVKEQDDDTA